MSGLHVCPACSSDLMQPVDWWTFGTSGRYARQEWCVHRRCPECGAERFGIHNQRDRAEYDKALEAAEKAIVWQIREFEIDRFVAALKADALLPCDLGRVMA